MISLFQGLVLAFIFGVITNGTPVEKRHTKYIAHEFHDTEVRLIGKRAEKLNYSINACRSSTKRLQDVSFFPFCYI